MYMNEPIPGEGIQPPVKPPVKDPSLKPTEFKPAMIGLEGTFIDATTGEIMTDSFSKDKWDSLSPLQKEMHLNGVQHKQDVALDKIRAKEAEQEKK